MTNNWPKKLGEVADILMGQSPPSSTYNNEGVGLPFFQGKAEFGDLYPKVDRYCSVPVRIAENRDILLSVRAPVGPINIAQEKTCIGRGLSAIRAKKEQANQWYLYYLLKQHEDNWEGSSGSTFQAINKTTIENLQIPLPNLNAQKIIVERLDVIRKAQELCDTQISKTEELFESILTSELDSKNSWNIKRLNDICDVRDGTHDSPKYHTSGIPLVTSKNLKDGEIDFINVNYISVEDHNKIIKRSLVEKGDILYGMIGTIGNPVIVNTDTVFSIKNVGLIKFNKSNINNYFVKYFLHSRRLNNQITKMSRGGTQKFVSLGNLRNLEIPIPTKDKQKKIVAKLNIVQGYKKLLFKQKTLLKELFDSVLYKSMNGEMDR